METKRCKGCNDSSPVSMKKFRQIEQALQACCKSWGYQEIRTPMLEYLHLFTAAGTLTPGMLRRVYSFLDWDGWSGERVVLKPEGTIPAARYYIENGDGEIARLYYVTNNFIFEETGTKARERWQGGVEFIGAGGAAVDVELISMALEVLGRLGFSRVKLNLSHAGLVRALLANLNVSETEQNNLFNRILDGDIAALEGIRPDNGEMVKIFELILDMKGKSSAFLRNIKAMVPSQYKDIKEALNDLLSSTEMLDELGITYQIDLTSGKGFEYYTGIIFRLALNGQNIGGGGRYDALIPLLGGEKKAAAGFALYMDRLVNVLAVKEENEAESVSIAAVDGSEKLAFKYAEAMRQAGYCTVIKAGSTDNARWKLKIDNRGGISLIDDKIKKEYNTSSIEEAVATVKGENVL